MRVLIVGGVGGGATAAARLRRLNESAEIVIFERGENISFANCGLPYYIGGTISERRNLLLHTPSSFGTRFNVDVRVMSEVTAINRQVKEVSVLNKLTQTTYVEKYDTLILSPGAMPIVPQHGIPQSDRIFTLRNLADIDRIKAFINKACPKRAAVIGAGFIGIEMVENLREAGIEVSLIEQSGQVMPPLDVDMACDIHKHIRQKGVSLHLNTSLQAVSVAGDSLSVELSSGTIVVDMIVLAMGVSPDSGLAKDAGLETNERGGIIVDRYMRTVDRNIYAVGDAVEVTDFVSGHQTLIPLAGPANKQARIAADNICGITKEYLGAQGSAAIKVFDMTVATTGINEKTAKKLNMNYAKVYLWHLGHAGYYPGSKHMSLKVIYQRDSGKILGAQAVGFDGVEKRCDVLSVAIRAGLTAFDLTKLEFCYAPPYNSTKDPVNVVGYMIENSMSGLVENCHWEDVEKLPNDGSVTLLDVRESREFADGNVSGFVNIPLDTLRKQINSLSRDRSIYVMCHSGLRSYVASRILSQNGYKVYNINGGYRLYRAVRDCQ